MGRLAIEGGAPVRSEPLPYGHQWIDEEDIASVVEVLKSNWVTQGPKVDEFEREVANYCGAIYAVAVSSGTAALHAACNAAGISQGDEVITTPITFAAATNVIAMCGGKPVFADIREESFNIDPEEIRKRLSPKTKAILPVDFAGHPADLDEIKAIAEEKQLTIIEDAAHAFGAEYKGRKIGSIVDMTTFSFHPVKQITTGEGGMVLSDNEDYYRRIKLFRHHGSAKTNPDKCSWYYEIDNPGHNFRITDFQCALGISQLKKVGRFIDRRRQIAARYSNAFAGMDEVVTPVEGKDVKAVYHIYIIQLRMELLKVGRNEIIEALRAENIQVNVHYMPIYLHPYYQREFGYKKGECPIAERYYERAITLPVFPKMSDADTEDVIAAVEKVIRHYRR